MRIARLIVEVAWRWAIGYPYLVPFVLAAPWGVAGSGPAWWGKAAGIWLACAVSIAIVERFYTEPEERPIPEMPRWLLIALVTWTARSAGRRQARSTSAGSSYKPGPAPHSPCGARFAAGPSGA